MRSSVKKRNRRRQTRKIRRGPKKRLFSGRAKKPRSIPLSQLPKRSKAARDRSLHVLAEMRNDPNLLLGRAARLHGVKPDTVRKYFPSALKRVGGRIRVT